MATLSTAGAAPTDPTTLRSELLATATALAPGLTADLPGSLIEDMASTATGAVVVMDQAYVDLINSINPITANEFILTQLGNVYGVQQGLGSNTSVYVTFTGTPGFVINIGFLVSDGNYQYSVQDATIIPSGGTTPAVYCLALVQGTWAVPVNTVTQIVTSIPSGISLSCTNSITGVPGLLAQSATDFRAQVIQAGRAVATGLPTLLKTALQNVSGVQYNLISVKKISSNWEIIVGGGDPYQVANAIYQSMFNILDLVGASGIGSTQTITINDFPDSYAIVFVVPLQQTVTIEVTWASTGNFVSNTVVATVVQPAIQNYINNIFVGQSISLLELNEIFVAATTGIIAPTTISTLSWVVNVNSSPVDASPILYPAEAEGYYFSNLTDITVIAG